MELNVRLETQKTRNSDLQEALDAANARIEEEEKQRMAAERARDQAQQDAVRRCRLNTSA